MNQKVLKELLHYDKDTGVFTWKDNGQTAGSPKCDYDYVYVTIFGKGYGLHTLAFLYVNGKFPEYQVKHTNQKPFDNRWCNLVEFTPDERRRQKENRLPDVDGVTCRYLYDGHKKSQCIWEITDTLEYFLFKSDAIKARKILNNDNF